VLGGGGIEVASVEIVSMLLPLHSWRA